MSLNIRRVVTGHDDQGRAKVLIDEAVKNVMSPRQGVLYSVIWSSKGFPVDNRVMPTRPARRSEQQFQTGRYFASSVSGRAQHRATTAPIRSTTQW